MLETLTLIIPCVEEVYLLERCLKSIEKVLPGQKVIVIQMANWTFDPYDGKNLQICQVRSPLLGVAAAKNFGARMVKTEYMALLDSDNWFIDHGTNWTLQLSKAMEQYPFLIALQRSEENRRLVSGIRPDKWNFSRHCIGWSVIWSYKHFWSLGGLDESCGTGSSTLAQAGEEFTILYKHFEKFSENTIYLSDLLIAHPSLDKPVPLKKKFAYAYGSNYNAMFQIRRKLSIMACFWYLKTIIGFGNDINRGLRSRSIMEIIILVLARLLALLDSIIRDMPRNYNP